MKILIAGGTGFIGSYIAKRFLQNGVEVNFVSRSKNHIQWKITDLTDSLEQTDILINLAGKSINCRHTPENQKLILNSRVDTTKMLGEALQKCKHKPLLWINASASAFYESENDYCLTETKYEEGKDFLADTVRAWEMAFFSFSNLAIRQVALRTSVVLGKNGGAFEPLQKLTKFGLGGKVGSGKQFFSWIHIEDYFRIIEYLIKNKLVQGAINVTSPTPVTNALFMKSMRQAMGVHFGLPAPEIAIKVGARFINTEAGLLLNPVRYCPETLINSGFKFKYPTCDSALKELVS